jgi:hypothetical protein
MEGVMKPHNVLTVIFLFFFSSLVFPQISITGSGPYTQDFNTLVNIGSSSVLPGDWYLFESGTGANTEYTAGTGSGTGGDTYSFGPSGDTERALGSLRTGTVISTTGANIINNTGNVISQLSITYTGEQWRAGVTNRNDADRLDFQYSTDATSLSDGNWTDVDQLDFLSPNINTNSGALNGNSSENRTDITFTITGLSIPNGAEFWVRWTDFDIASSDDGLAIDDFEIDITAPAVVFSITPTSLNFGNVTVGSSSTLPVTVENQGTTDNLDITNAVSSNPVFTFLPNSFPVSIIPGGSQVFNVTFTPTGDGPETGTIEFTHNAPGSPTSLSLSGTGEAPAQGGLLKFKSSVRDLLDGTQDNPDTIVLSGYSGQPLKALQFNLLIGKTNGGLILRSISRGAATPVADFNFSYQIYPGNFLPDGSSIDTVKVVIIGNNDNEILPDAGDQEILIFSYDLVSIAGVSAQTFNSLDAVTGATSTPVINANITTGSDETVNIFNGTLEGLLGDVNIDNQVNILDLLLMIDYILGRVEFDSDQFFKGDIAPWSPGDPLPTRDGVIDVLDLAVLQNIVLTGSYPSGVSVYKLVTGFFEIKTNNIGKLTPGMNAKVTFYFTNNRISVGLESVKKVKGLQIELNKLTSLIPHNTQMTSVFDQAIYYQNNSFLRMLSYDGQSNPIIPGEYMVADIPFTVINPENIIVENVIVADENNNALDKVEIEILLEGPDIPDNYILHQNYPNPFNPNTSIRYEVPQDGFVTVQIFDMLGQEVTTLFSGNTKAGKYTLNWDGTDRNGKQVSSGSYIYRMSAGEFVKSMKMILIR